jgi:drug/metabolite transporter (DMT)-like permease
MSAPQHSPPRGSGSGFGFSTADFYLLLTVFIWGNTFPVAKYILGFLPPMAYATTRYLLAALVLLGLMAMRGGLQPPRRRDIPALALLGFIGVTMMQLLWTNALTFTAASKGAILVAVSPIFAMLMTTVRNLVKRESTPGALAWSGVLLSFAGVFLVINNSLTGITLDGGDLVGDLMFLGVAFCWATYSVMGPRYIASLGALRVTAWSMLFGSLLLIPLSIVDIARADWGATTLTIWAGFLFTSVGAGALGYLWWYEGVAKLGVARAATYSYLIPVFAMISAALVLGESISLAQTIGAAVVLAGLMMTRLGTQRTPGNGG